MKNHLNKSVVVTFFLILGITDAFSQKNKAFQKGEELLFKVSFGFFDAAEAKMVVNPTIYTVDSQPSYKIDVYGQTLGIFKLFKVNDNWGSYLDTTKIIPHQSYRHIEEGKYRKHEKVFFNHNKKNAKVKLYDRENINLVETKEYKVPENVQDIVSGFYYLRTMNLSGLKKGDQITLTGFFDKEIYNLKLIYGGKELIKTRLGSFDTFIFSPVMPKNKIFRGEQPVTVWITDDRNKIPIRIKAKLMVGSLDMEIMEAKGLRND
ncbi:Protein of unknown function [Aquiflexum balticum DSM 16537]|uniref:DUF3108 domain-containing protein n=1 Tax=Aquiflexum balticum DSM 16537 TaxID=758820 RepID=A0A1W2H419_9BACT|nr:DUF3108 domain-containing protein [Aquiflexum balticum]SMD43362.1 Protein of unknown function [Aquiflexum balticum DSM 16537]